MPEHSLNVLHCALLLRQGCDCPPNHLKRELGQFQVSRQFVQNPSPVVVRIEKPTCLIREDEGSGRRIGGLLLPALKIVRESSMASSRTVTPSKNCLSPFFAVPMRTPWVAYWSKESPCYQLHATMPRRFFAMQRPTSKVDTDAIAIKVKQEFAAKERRRRPASPHRNQPKPRKLRNLASHEKRSADQQTSFHFRYAIHF